MRSISLIGIGTLVLGLAIGTAACGSDSDDGDGAGGSGNASGSNGGSGSGAEGGTGSGASGSASGGSGSSAGGAGSGGSTGSGGAVAYCAQSCAAPADCCPDGVPNCPGDAYPNNYGCEEGICTPPQCATDDDCTFGGTVPGYGCLDISDFKVCSLLCEEDADCTAPTTCSGTDDNGTKYCAGEATGDCTSDADCPAGYGGTCDVDTGACTCGDDADCSGVGVDTCVEP